MSNYKIPLFFILFFTFSGFSVIDCIIKNLNRTHQTFLAERNNYWSYFASKSIKSRLYEIQRNNVSLFLATTSDKDEAAAIESIGKNIDNELSRYDQEKQAIQAKAIDFDNKYEQVKDQLESLHLLQLGFAMIFGFFALAALLIPNQLKQRSKLMVISFTIMIMVFVLLALI